MEIWIVCNCGYLRITQFHKAALHSAVLGKKSLADNIDSHISTLEINQIYIQDLFLCVDTEKYLLWTS